MSLESKTGIRLCVLSDCCEKLVGSQSELSTASRRCFRLGDPSLSTTQSCSSDSVTEQGWSSSESSSRSPSNALSKMRASASFTDIMRLAI